MIEEGLTQSRRGTKGGGDRGPAVLRGFVSSCESIFRDHDAAQSGDIGDNQETWLQTTVTGPGSLRFDFKLSCDPSNDGLGLYVDGLAVGFWTASGVWSDPGPFSITGSGTHTIRWKYIKGGSGSAGSDCLWIDNVRWTGAMPDVNEIEYVYDLSGRRIEKKVDGDTELKFLYDGDHILAEYDANDTLLRKYVHGITGTTTVF